MPDWDERWEYIIELGRELPDLDQQFKSTANLVHGCMSTVWLVTRAKTSEETDRLEILADSDSLIVKGLIVILLSLYKEKTLVEVMRCDEKSFLAKLGLDQHLSPNRRNGLFSMVSRIKELATELEAMG